MNDERRLHYVSLLGQQVDTFKKMWHPALDIPREVKVCALTGVMGLDITSPSPLAVLHHVRSLNGQPDEVRAYWRSQEARILLRCLQDMLVVGAKKVLAMSLLGESWTGRENR